MQDASEGGASSVSLRRVSQSELFPGFEEAEIATSGAVIHLRRGGQGPAVLLLHGFPETHVQWHQIAPKLTEHFTVVCADLRGHGDSAKPPAGPGFRNYAKSIMALDQVEVMRALGFERFYLVGHDRGGRVAHRLALDHPDRVEKLALLDIGPMASALDAVNARTAGDNYHWFFLAQPHPLPERLIEADPTFFLRWHLRAWSGGVDDFFDPRALAEYERCFSDPEMIRATCDDLRALVSIDAEAERADAGRRFACPLLVAWGTRWRSADLVEPWRAWADDVQGIPLDCGHFIAEERPAELTTALLEFFAV